MPFEPEPELQYDRGGRYRIVNDPVYLGKNENEKIEIRHDFITDLATSPRIFWAWIPPFGTYELAAILHDWLLKQLQEYHKATRDYAWKVKQLPGSMWPPKPEPPQINSTDTDGLFRRVMREGNVGFVKRWVMWAAVRWGALFSEDGYRRAGWWSWPEAPLVLLITAAEAAVMTAAAVGIHLTVDWILGVF